MELKVDSVGEFSFEFDQYSYDILAEPVCSENEVFTTHKCLKEALDEHKKQLDQKVINDKDDILSRFNPLFHERFKIAEKISQNEDDRKKINTTWLKTYEIMNRFFKDEYAEFSLFDCAGLPGNTIFAIKHYFANTKKAKFTWNGRAEVTNKYQPDKYGLVKANRGQWNVATGMITDVAIIDSICRGMKGRAPDLFFSDYAMDFSSDYNNQERMFMPYITAQIMIAIRTLTKGGNMCIKQYSAFESYTLSYITILKEMFEEFYMYKPIASKQQNSEIFIVGLRYKYIGQNCAFDPTRNPSPNCCKLHGCANMRKFYKALKLSLETKTFKPIVHCEVLYNFLSKYSEFFINLYYEKQMAKLKDMFEFVNSSEFIDLPKREQTQKIKMKMKDEIGLVRIYKQICGL